MIFCIGLKQIHQIFKFVFDSNSFEAIIVTQNIEIIIKMTDTSNEESLSVSTTSTTADTGEMYGLVIARVIRSIADMPSIFSNNGHKRCMNPLVCMASCK